MASKKTGFEFWNDVLKKPKYVAAPMVDMSEFAFRMLCRRHGAQLCYSPMLHSLQYAQDFLYRKDNFSTSSDDRPLIIQFCANMPETFVEAATLVAKDCDAVDLNLGCPQAIARKGYYGAFLQDDWQLIHSMIRKAASDLPVPVTAKMRILPGHLKKSIEYARMLEEAGCSVLTVHGRTREQKGHATGLASWEVIKEIKANVNVPVIANGNILSFDDVVHCLDYTKADAVMSAEALLHNPALFSGKNPPVWNVVEEYLSIAEKCNTPIKCIRCHLFKILYLCLHLDERITQILADASTINDFYAVCEVLKQLPDTTSDKEITADENLSDLDELFNDFSFNEHEFQQEDFAPAPTKSETNEHTSLHSLSTNNNTITPTTVACNNVQLCTETDLIYESKSEVENDGWPFIKQHVNLPVWLCHSRPRVGDNEKSRGCFSGYFSSSNKVGEEHHMSKKKLRRERRHERVLAAKKDKRKVKKMRHKLKIAEMKRNQPITDEVETKEKLTKKQQKMLIRERLLKAQGTAPKVCINLGFASSMNEKEMGQLSSQLRRLYGSNRQSLSPLHLCFCNLSTSDELYQICLAKNDGFSSYIVEMTPEEPETLFKEEDLIYLSPDSENVLETLDINKIYVIGGIVDGTVKKDLSLNHAKDNNIQTARLPIAEYLVQCSANPGTTVLTVNQVFDILLKYYETENWTEALSSNVPQRKGFCAPPNSEKSSQIISEHEKTHSKEIVDSSIS